MMWESESERLMASVRKAILDLPMDAPHYAKTLSMQAELLLNAFRDQRDQLLKMESVIHKLTK